MTNNNQTMNLADDVNGSESKKPIKTFDLGRLTVAIWRRQDKKGSYRYRASLARSYKTEEGYRDTNSLDEEDLAFGARLLMQAQAWILEQPFK